MRTELEQLENTYGRVFLKFLSREEDELGEDPEDLTLTLTLTPTLTLTATLTLTLTRRGAGHARAALHHRAHTRGAP